MLLSEKSSQRYETRPCAIRASSFGVDSRKSQYSFSIMGSFTVFASKGSLSKVIMHRFNPLLLPSVTRTCSGLLAWLPFAAETLPCFSNYGFPIWVARFSDAFAFYERLWTSPVIRFPGYSQWNEQWNDQLCRTLPESRTQSEILGWIMQDLAGIEDPIQILESRCNGQPVSI